ncbi:MAG: DoxX family protein [Sphingomonadaceae bacterium]
MNTLLSLHQQVSRWNLALSVWGGSLLSLVLRLWIGWQFFHAGWLKLQDWESTLALFRDEYHVPVLAPGLAAYLGAGGELLLPLLLFAGLFARPAALALFAVNVVAVWSYPQLFGFECPAAINDHIFWGVSLLVLAVFGPGRLALDAGLARRYGSSAV